MLARIRELMAAIAVLIAVATSTVLADPVPAEPQTVRVAAFNIQVFGRTKLQNEQVMQVLMEVAQQFDVMVVQEVRDRTQQTAGDFLDRINAASPVSYAMFEGPPLGRTSSKEQYVLYYVPARVQLLYAGILPDPDDEFEREPLLALMRAGNFDFGLLAIHIKPDAAEAELRLLAAAAQTILEANPAEQDLILLGDFNADGRYLDEGLLVEIFPMEDFHVVITNDMVTTTKTQFTYDRVVLSPGTFGYEYVPGSAQPFLFDVMLGIDDPALTPRVSDHYPVFAEFRIDRPDDD
jgi:endonuclease/exonuclease/phosphatase family metal-dependent hydrolase